MSKPKNTPAPSAKPPKAAKATQAAQAEGATTPPALANKPGKAPVTPPAPPESQAPPAPPADVVDLEAERAAAAKERGTQGGPKDGKKAQPTLPLLIPSPFVEKEGLGPYISHRVDLQARDLNAEEKAGLEMVIKAYHGKATGDWRKVASTNPQCFRLLLRDIARAGKGVMAVG
jgi:hypothetical protein